MPTFTFMITEPLDRDESVSWRVNILVYSWGVTADPIISIRREADKDGQIARYCISKRWESGWAGPVMGLLIGPRGSKTEPEDTGFSKFNHAPCRRRGETILPNLAFRGMFDYVLGTARFVDPTENGYLKTLTILGRAAIYFSRRRHIPATMLLHRYFALVAALFVASTVALPVVEAEAGPLEERQITGSRDWRRQITGSRDWRRQITGSRDWRRQITGSRDWRREGELEEAQA
ncbi:hypothetical protein WG66_011770 [Moniliophthora roreri]|uniref:Uncharacterized protein n=2 Tax=Moniliophthora roreri TaxID=221103 RepID=A0A0W0F5X9_MONRR|nr:hypothetical protein WG66_011770 [Moniliophthora roreri]